METIEIQPIYPTSINFETFTKPPSSGETIQPKRVRFQSKVQSESPRREQQIHGQQSQKSLNFMPVYKDDALNDCSVILLESTDDEEMQLLCCDYKFNRILFLKYRLLVQLFIFIVTLMGSIYNAFHSHLAFYLWLVSNIISVIYYLMTKQFIFGIQQLMFTTTTIIALYNIYIEFI